MAPGGRRAAVAATDIQHAKTHLSELLKRVEEGEEITIARAGTPIAKLIATRKPRPTWGTLAHLGPIDIDGLLEPLSSNELDLWTDGGHDDPLNQ